MRSSPRSAHRRFRAAWIATKVTTVTKVRKTPILITFVTFVAIRIAQEDSLPSEVTTGVRLFVRDHESDALVTIARLSAFRGPILDAPLSSDLGLRQATPVED